LATLAAKEDCKKLAYYCIYSSCKKEKHFTTMKPSFFLISITALVFIFISCKNEPKKIVPRKKPSHQVQYIKQDGSKWCRLNRENKKAIRIVTAVNRADFQHLENMDSILVPDVLDGDIYYYLPFPFSVNKLEKIDKVIFFSYATQSFGAYENGELVYTGATSMGRKTDPTPTGLYFTNWKAEQSTSTFNDEWDLKWNVNIENKLGIGWHQYEMPGYPASHSCLRLQESDARYLYNWAEQWVLNKDEVKKKGTAVIVFGKYNFDGTKPWLQLLKDPHALDINEKEINQITAPYLKEITADQAEKKKPQQKKD
jgi:L,D-transpeptidase catalytic domain